MTNSNKLNKHFKKQFDSSNCSLLPKNIADSVRSDFEIMSSIGIDNDEDQNVFFHIRHHVPDIIRLVFNGKFNDKINDAISAEVFRSREKFPTNTLLGLIEATDLALKKMIPPNLRPKIAYPQPGARQHLPQYDIGRWVAATREIYGLMVKGYDNEDAKKHVIGNWESREKMDYEQWLKFYKERVPEKYPKLAYDDTLSLGGLPVEVLQAKMHLNKGKFPNPIAGGEGNAQKRSPGLPQLPSEGDNNSVRDKIETQRKKLVSRLNSAEKMLASMDGQMFAGDDQELMLKLLQDLKRRIQIANKRTAKSTLFEDHIYRTANHLKLNGKDKAADFFFKIAQFGDMPGGPGGPPDMGSPPGGAPGGGEDDAAKKETHDLLQEFFDNITRGISDKDDTPEKREELEKKEKEGPGGGAPPGAPPPPSPGGPGGPGGPPPPSAATKIQDQIKLGKGFWNQSKFAQVPPAPAPVPPAPPKDVIVQEEPAEDPADNTDDVIEAALKNVSVQDVISRLEMLVSIYNQREISRQLAILDIMMDRLGLASFFPALGEAMSKALEANQYIGNRLEEILGKIKGSVDVPGASEWIEAAPAPNPQTAGIRNRLEQEEAEEEKRREMRKQKDLAKMQPGAGIPTGPESAAAAGPSLAESVDLQRPARVEKAPPIRTR